MPLELPPQRRCDDSLRLQARAVFEAAASMTQAGVTVRPDVMVPLVGGLPELRHQEQAIRAVAEQVIKESGVKVRGARSFRAPADCSAPAQIK